MKKPVLLHYYITNRCNARCAFCDIWREQPKADARLSDVAANIGLARAAGCRFVDFTGGEPLLHPDLPEFLRITKKAGLMTSVTTNCLLFEERAGELAGLIDLPHFSIDADTPLLHDKIRGCQSYGAVLRSIDAAIANRVYPDLLFTYTEENIGAVEGVWKLAREKRLILILDPVFAVWGPDKLPPGVHLKAMEFAKRRGVYLNRAHLLLRGKGGNRTRAPICRAATSTIVITPDDNLTLPCYHHRCAAVKINGNLTRALKSAERLDALAKEGRYAFCEGCHINCYFDPSYQLMSGRFLWESMKGKAKYALTKYLLYRRPWPKI